MKHRHLNNKMNLLIFRVVLLRNNFIHRNNKSILIKRSASNEMRCNNIENP